LNKQEGELFLAQNKKRPEVKTTESGLQYEVLVQGNGEQPTAADTVTCHYRGTFLDGKGFDNSYDRGQPISFPLTGVIRGWTEGLQLMNTGSKYRFYIPYTLGYGEFDYMSIPGGSMLIFEVELIDIKRKK
jgi:FKBP-type peptidyl-prolyl cis-trans isomerase